MPTTLTEKKTEELQAGGGGDFFGDGDGRSWGGGDGAGRNRDPLPEYMPPPEGYRIALLLTLISVTMFFMALASAFVFGGANLHPMITPRALWISTGIILASSGTLEFARVSMRRRQEPKFRTWIFITMTLGFCFLVSQLIAWQELVQSGYYVNKNIHSGYAYIFTGLHAVHLIGGLIALAYVTFRSRQNWTALRRRVSVDATALYWHFIDGLWLFLLGLVFLWK
jgi:cytochrome c oxidase subunit 3